MTQGMAVNQPKALGRGGKNKGFTVWLQLRGKNQGKIPKYPMYFAKDLKSKSMWRLL